MAQPSPSSPIRPYLIQLDQKLSRSPQSKQSYSCLFLLYCLLSHNTSNAAIPSRIPLLRIQETQLLQRDRATLYVSKFMLCFTKHGTLRMSRSEFHHVWRQQTGVLSVVRVTINVAILIKQRLVTDRQTETERQGRG